MKEHHFQQDLQSYGLEGAHGSHWCSLRCCPLFPPHWWPLTTPACNIWATYFCSPSARETKMPKEEMKTRYIQFGKAHIEHSISKGSINNSGMQGRCRGLLGGILLTKLYRAQLHWGNPVSRKSLAIQPLEPLTPSSERTRYLSHHCCPGQDRKLGPTLNYSSHVAITASAPLVQLFFSFFIKKHQFM